MARLRSGDDDHDVLKIALLATLVISSTACTGTWGNPGHSRTTHHALVASYVASTAISACDVGQTIHVSNGGRWDRRVVVNGQSYRALESNPMLGKTPRPELLAGIAIANAVAGYVLIQAPLPAWLKGLWFGSIGAVETAMVVNNAPWGGACGFGVSDSTFAASDVGRK